MQPPLAESKYFQDNGTNSSSTLPNSYGSCGAAAAAASRISGAQDQKNYRLILKREEIEARSWVEFGHVLLVAA